MNEKYADLEEETARSIANELASQQRETFVKLLETDKWLTQLSFLVNAGGAVATLGFLGTVAASEFALLPLSFFLSGIVASGIEIRALLQIYRHLHNDALRRRSEFVSGELSVGEAGRVESPNKRVTNISHWSGIIAQLAFVLGAITGVIGISVRMLTET